MKFEVRKISVHSLREFVGEYLMIVVGILTALGLEHMVTTAHHRKAAEHARHQIIAEIHTNLESIDQTQRRNKELRASMQALCDDLVREIQAGTPRAEVNRQLAERFQKGVELGASFPTLHKEAWEVAVANQSAAHMQDRVLKRLSAVYAAQRDYEITLRDAGNFINGARMADAFTDLRLRRADPVEFLKVVNHMIVTIHAFDGNLKELRGVLAAAAEDEKTGR